MFTILDELQYRINKDITDIQVVWDDNPDNELFFAEISGLKRALEHVKRARASELNELDKWASEEYKRKEIKMEMNVKERTHNNLITLELVKTDVQDVIIGDVVKVNGSEAVKGAFKKVIKLKSEHEEVNLNIYSDDGWDLYTPKEKDK